MTDTKTPCANCGHDKMLHGMTQAPPSNWCIAPASGDRAKPFTFICNCEAFVEPRPLGEAEPATDTTRGRAEAVHKIEQRFFSSIMRLHNSHGNYTALSYGLTEAINERRAALDVLPAFDDIKIVRQESSRRAPQDDAGAEPATGDRRLMVLVRNPGGDWWEYSAGTLLSHDEAKRLVDELQSDGFQREVRIVGVLVFTSTVAARRASGAAPTTGENTQ